ncbi:uncharacterized protein LOC111257129 [Setaria italica]|uniref:uncharacterized protein LOC111257129 n=1 Tax=Setaria italica TaxID=4555 RepID=UPI000BE60D51|nr:uncharacterized protein LOC111257129 [Setaria italica]
MLLLVDMAKISHLRLTLWCRVLDRRSLRRNMDAEDTIHVDTEVESCPSTTLSSPLVDLTVDDVPEVDTSHLGATMSMLQEVLRSVESPAVPSSSGGVPSSTSTGGTLALVDVTKADEASAPGDVLGRAPEPQIVKNAEGPVLELPLESEFQRAIQSFQVCFFFCLTVFS